MRLIKLELNNFGSYKHLEFDFGTRGLTLVHGAMGAGKSTIFDAVCWVLYGKTAKNGNVSEIIKWDSPGDVRGTLVIQCGELRTTIIRTRGASNDLHFTQDQSITRGSSIADTQRLLDNVIGMSYDLYVMSAYYHENSPAVTFFSSSTSSKARAIICEHIADIANIKEKQALLKELKQESNRKEKDTKVFLAAKAQNLNYIKSQISKTEIDIAVWNTNQANNKEKFETDRAHNLESLAKKAQALDSQFSVSLIKAESSEGKCPTCGNLDKKIYEKLYSTKANLDIIESEIKQLSRKPNPYTESNPHERPLGRLLKDKQKEEVALAELEGAHLLAVQEAADAATLHDLLVTYKGRIIHDTLFNIQYLTNKFLSDYFDAEMQVELTIEDLDKIEASIIKNGHKCEYTQLSRGQKQLLRLCFTLSIMQHVANKSGTQVSTIFLDEAFDNIGEAMKTKAYNLLKALSHTYDNVMVVEHSVELKALFDSKIYVEMTNNESKIYEET